MKMAHIHLTDREAKHAEKVLASQPESDAVSARVAHKLATAKRHEKKVGKG